MALSREEIASRYSKALFAYAQDTNSLDAVHEDMNVLLQVAKETPDMLRLLSDPIIRKDQKEEFLSSFSDKFSVETKNFLDFLLEYRRFESLTAIIEAFNTLYDEYKNIASGTAVSAIKLNEDELSRISQAYAKKYVVSTVSLPSVLLQESKKSPISSLCVQTQALRKEWSFTVIRR